MAHIVYQRKGGVGRLVVNDVDLTNEVYRDVELVEVGEGELAEAGLRITLVVSTLTLDAEKDVTITDNFRAVAQRVRSMGETDD